MANLSATLRLLSYDLRVTGLNLETISLFPRVIKALCISTLLRLHVVRVSCTESAALYYCVCEL